MLELVLHLTSVFTIHNYSKEVVDEFSKSSLVLSLFLKTSLFTTKYIVIYGVTNFFNKIVGMSVVDLPRCVLMMNTSSEMWRYFDTGLYEFIKE